MPCQFDQLIDRRSTYSKKWDDAAKLYGEEGLLPMWIADMDFLPPPEVVQAIQTRAAHGIYGYESTPEDCFEIFRSWLLQRHGWEIDAEWIVPCPGVVSGLAFAVNIFSAPGDRIVIQPPVYPPFYRVVENSQRQVVESPLLLADGKFVMDYESLEKQFRSGAKLMILCSPHNPVGRIWTKKELDLLAQLAVKYGVTILSDEIWSDLAFHGYKHRPLASLSPEIAAQTITFMAPSKTFNLAAFYSSSIIISDPDLRQAFTGQLQRFGIAQQNLFGIVAAKAAYSHGGPWLDQLLIYLEENARCVIEQMAAMTSKISIIEPEGTFLLWLDCRGLGLPAEEVNKFFVAKTKIAFNDGAVFGPAGRGFQRMNIGCPRSTIEEALKRMAAGLRTCP